MDARKLIPATLVKLLSCAPEVSEIADTEPGFPATRTLRQGIKLFDSNGAYLDRYGWSVAGVGDVDGDGYDDVIVGAMQDDDEALGAGGAFLYYGGPGGIDLLSEVRFNASDAATPWGFGYSVAGAGDVDGDGYDDVIVGADSADPVGAAYMYLGSSGGIDLSSERKLFPADTAEVQHFADVVSGAGDVNGDGYDDVIVGAHKYGHEIVPNDSGAAYVYLGGPTGIDPATELRLVASDRQRWGYFGESVSGAGDIDGDGYDDVIVGSYGNGDPGSFYLYFGSPAGIDVTTEAKVLGPDEDLGVWFGDGVSGAGDVNGDGYDDVLIGDTGDVERARFAGAAFVYLGSDAGIDAATPLKIMASDGAEDDYFGDSVSGAGDVDGDGYDDVVIGAKRDDDGGEESGSAYLYFGSSTGIDPSREVKLVALDGAAEDELGYSVSGAGDVDGDGFADFIAGAPWASSEGAAYVFVSSCPPLTWYLDGDGDGYGDPASTVEACELPSGYIDNADDCDDAEPLAWTDAVEVCDEVDNDCDGTVDNADPALLTTWYADADGDEFTDTANTVSACYVPSGYGEASAEPDCDDADLSEHPGADELCDGEDDDCDGAVDEDSVDASTWYADADRDGFTSAHDTVVGCEPPEGYFGPSDEPDCDDKTASVFPGAWEVADDGIDQDCDGVDLVSDPVAPAVDGEGGGLDEDEGCGGCASGDSIAIGLLPLIIVLALRKRVHVPPG